MRNILLLVVGLTVLAALIFGLRALNPSLTASSVGQKGQQGEVGPTGPRGDVGPEGNPGSAGAKGADGLSILTGTGAPAALLGVDGQVYVDTKAANLYLKSGGVWGSPTPLLGPAGAAGPAGAQGPQGPAGASGAQGPTGASGADGLSVLTGTGVPSNGSGSDGQAYIDTQAGDLYVKSGGAWGAPTSLIGPTGPAGAQGPQGPAGPVGPQGPAGSATIQAFTNQHTLAWVFDPNSGTGGRTDITDTGSFSISGTHSVMVSGVLAWRAHDLHWHVYDNGSVIYPSGNDDITYAQSASENNSVSFAVPLTLTNGTHDLAIYIDDAHTTGNITIDDLAFSLLIF